MNQLQFTSSSSSSSSLPLSSICRLSPVHLSHGPHAQSNYLLWPPLPLSHSDHSGRPNQSDRSDRPDSDTVPEFVRTGPGPCLIVGSYPWLYHGHGTLSILVHEYHIDTLVSLVVDGEKGHHWDIYDRDARTLKSDIEILHLPIPDGHISPDNVLISLVYDLVEQLKRKRRVFLSCFGGHGRSATVSAILLHLLFHFDAQTALKEVAIRHDQRRTVNAIAAPQSPAQTRQVERIIDHFTRGTPLQDPSEDPSRIEPLITQLDRNCRHRIVQRKWCKWEENRWSEWMPKQKEVVDRIQWQSAILTRLSVMSWNILAPSLTNTTSFPHTDPRYLTYEHRASLWLQQLHCIVDDDLHVSSPATHISNVDTLDDKQVGDSLTSSLPVTNSSFMQKPASARQINETDSKEQDPPLLHHLQTHHMPDIVALQEVDEHIFNNVLLPYFVAHNYDGLLALKKQRSADATTSTDTSSPTERNGCCLFYNQKRLAMMGYRTLELNPDQSQVAIIAQLSPIVKNRIASRHRLFVATAHLKAKPEYEQLRAQQMATLMREIVSYQNVLHAPTNSYPLSAHTLCLGDFNDTPDSLVSQTVSSSTQILLRSIYEAHYGSSHHKADEFYTTYKYRECVVQRIIDYIYASPQSITPLAVLAIPSSKHFPNCLPCDSYPSDHVAIAAQIALLTHELVWNDEDTQEDDDCLAPLSSNSDSDQRSRM